MEIAVIRAMPNTPSALGAGAAGLCRGRFVKPEQMELAERIFETVGRTVVVDEKHMDAVTGLSASGPAYIYIIIEALAEAGVQDEVLEHGIALAMVDEIGNRMRPALGRRGRLLL